MASLLLIVNFKTCKSLSKLRDSGEIEISQASFNTSGSGIGSVIPKLHPISKNEQSGFVSGIPSFDESIPSLSGTTGNNGESLQNAWNPSKLIEHPYTQLPSLPKLSACESIHTITSGSGVVVEVSSLGIGLDVSPLDIGDGVYPP